METRHLGGQLAVSALGLGCMGMSGTYGERSETEALATIERALDLGITFFDTANVYGLGHNETLLGRAFAGRFHRITLATKCGFVAVGGALQVDGSPAHITKSCDESLKRLGTDVIDLYYLHRPDPKTPIEDSVGAMAALKKAGKIRHIGLSEVNAATLRRAVGEHPIAALQSEWSLFLRDIEAEILPTCRALGVALVPFSPLGRGLLTGKIRGAGDLTIKGDYRSARMPRFQGENLTQNLALVAKVEAVAKAHGATPAQIALAWLLAQGKDVVPIPGASRLATLEDNAGAASVKLSDTEKASLSTIAADVAGARYGTGMNITNLVDTPPRA